MKNNRHNIGNGWSWLAGAGWVSNRALGPEIRPEARPYYVKEGTMLKREDRQFPKTKCEELATQTSAQN